MSQVENKINDILDFVRDNFTEQNITTSFLAKKFGVDKYMLSRAINKRIGRLDLYIQDLRIDYSKTLASTNLSIKEICFSSGFGSLDQFNRVFKTKFKKTYKQFRLSIVEINNAMSGMDKIKYHLKQIEIELNKMEHI